MSIYLLLIVTGLFLAFANGANDNFKGVATLYGSRTTSFRVALLWATAVTFLGSIVAIRIAGGLTRTFTGRGLVPETIAGSPQLLIAVGLGAAITVILATAIGMPVSTTHALVGALLGAAWIAAPARIRFGTLGWGVMAPLLLSPIIAVGLTRIVYPAFRFGRRSLGLTKESCLCLGSEVIQTIPEGSAARVATATAALTLSLGQEVDCVERYQGSILGLNAQKTLAAGHFLSSGLVSFARGLNDTPKIAALLLISGTVGGDLRFWAIGIGIALGGLLSARKVARTMSRRITRMNHGQGFSANLVTAFLVVIASRWGLPVSTTHVSCGSLFGLSLVTGGGNRKTIRNILLAWGATLPIAALIGALLYLLLAPA